MKKLRIIIVTVAVLWLVSYLISLGIGGNERVVGNGIAIIPIKGAIFSEDSNDVFGGSGMGSDSIINNLMLSDF